jgi:hypothetical protein
MQQSFYMTTYSCPVCAFTGLDAPPEDHMICACCGTHFGYEDVSRGYRELRNQWLRSGGRWFNTEHPYFLLHEHWNAWDQLDGAGLRYDVPNPRPRIHAVRIPAQSVVDVGVWGGGETCRAS